MCVASYVYCALHVVSVCYNRTFCKVQPITISQWICKWGDFPNVRIARWKTENMLVLFDTHLNRTWAVNTIDNSRVDLVPPLTHEWCASRTRPMCRTCLVGEKVSCIIASLVRARLHDVFDTVVFVWLHPRDYVFLCGGNAVTLFSCACLSTGQCLLLLGIWVSNISRSGV